MSYGYGQRQNPYDQRDPAPGGYGQNSGYGNSGYNQGPPIEAGYGSSNVEMASLARNAGPPGNSQPPRSVLQQCNKLNDRLLSLEEMLQNLRGLQQRSLDDVDSSANSRVNRELDEESTKVMAEYRTLTEDVRLLKSNPESQSSLNVQQVGNIDRRLKQAIRDYQALESAFRGKTRVQMERQYRIVRPDASDEEIRAAVDDPNGGQIFSQALMQSDRQGRARAALSAVQDRHAAIVKIEQQMVELAQLFQDMDTLVVQQEVAVQQIEQKAEEVVDNLDKGNQEIVVAVDTARKTRKKKWICLGICVAIILVIVIIVLIYIFVVKGGGNGDNKRKRDLVENLGGLPIVNTLPVHSAARLMARVPQGDLPEPLGRVFRERVHLPQMM